MMSQITATDDVGDQPQSSSFLLLTLNKLCAWRHNMPSPRPSTGISGLMRGLATLPQGGSKEPSVVRDSDGRPQEDPLAVYCFCVCSGSALLGDLLGVSRSMERDLLSVLSIYPRIFFCVFIVYCRVLFCYMLMSVDC